MDYVKHIDKNSVFARADPGGLYKTKKLPFIHVAAQSVQSYDVYGHTNIKLCFGSRSASAFSQNIVANSFVGTETKLYKKDEVYQY